MSDHYSYSNHSEICSSPWAAAPRCAHHWCCRCCSSASGTSAAPRRTTRTVSSTAVWRAALTAVSLGSSGLRLASDLAPTWGSVEAEDATGTWRGAGPVYSWRSGCRSWAWVWAWGWSRLGEGGYVWVDFGSLHAMVDSEVVWGDGCLSGEKTLAASQAWTVTQMKKSRQQKFSICQLKQKFSICQLKQKFSICQLKEK